MDLIVFSALIWDIEDYFIWGGVGSKVGAQLAGVTAHAWGGELDACGYMPAFRIADGQCQPAADGGHAVTAGGVQQL